MVSAFMGGASLEASTMGGDSLVVSTLE